MSYTCKFCNQPCNSWVPYCKACKVNYEYSNDRLITQTYSINNEKYIDIVMSIYDNETRIYLHSQPEERASMIVFPGTHPETNPKDIIKLVDRLLNLLVFS